MKRFIDLLLRIRVILITLLVIVLTQLLALISSRINILDSIEYSVSDFDFTDIYFSNQIEDNPPDIDPTIILVDIGDLNRLEIAQLLRNLQKLQPRVLGMDALFRGEKEERGDSILQSALREVDNLILASRPIDYDPVTGKYDGLYTSDPEFLQDRSTGSAKLIGDGKVGEQLFTIRAFYPKERLENDFEFHFGVQVARYYDEVKAFKFLQRDNEVELINFKRSMEHYRVLTPEQINSGLNPDPYKEKIILVGYLGLNSPKDDLEDIFFTPLNQKIAGRSYPDTRGVVIHANIVSMILEEDYFNDWRVVSSVGSFVILLCFMFLLSWIFIRFMKNYQLVSKVITFVMINVLVLASLWIFSYFQVKVDFRMAIFYLVFAPDAVEILEINIFNRIRRLRVN